MMFGGAFEPQSMSESDQRYCFLVEWYDPHASLIRRYQLLFYPKDQSLEMFDFKKHKVFLKRTKCENVTLDDLYIGGIINVFSRQLSLVDYGDDYSRKILGSHAQKTLALLTEPAILKVGNIIELIQKKGLRITKMKMCEISSKEAADFCEEYKKDNNHENMVASISAKPILAMELLGDNAISTWKEMMGPDNPNEAISKAPSSITARFRKGNLCYGPASPAEAARQLEFFFPSSGYNRKNTAIMEDCTCCVIKPHAVNDGHSGKIINAIMSAGFELTALQMFYLERANAEEFLEVYKGVVPEFPSMVNEMITGPCIAMALRAKDAPKVFRDVAGPADPEIARHLRPQSLRALFGVTKIKNAIHCTDLPEDGVLEVEYFFKILDR